MVILGHVSMVISIHLTQLKERIFGGLTLFSSVCASGEWSDNQAKFICFFLANFTYMEKQFQVTMLIQNHSLIDMFSLKLNLNKGLFLISFCFDRLLSEIFLCFLEEKQLSF